MGRGLNHEDAALLQEVLHNVLSNTLTGRSGSRSKNVDLRQLREDVLSIAHAALFTCAREHNQLAAINRLPVELICRVAFFLPYADRCVAALICSHWRSALLSSPSLWSRIVLDLKFKPLLGSSLLPTLADRSRHLSLDIELRCRVHDPDAIGEVCSTLMNRMPFIRRLSLSAPQLASMPWLDLLTIPAPRLEEARLSCIFDGLGQSDANSLPSTLFGGHAPLLRHFCLDGLKLSMGRTSALENVRAFVHLRIYTFDDHTLDAILWSCPALRSLTALPTMHYNARVMMQTPASRFFEGSLRLLRLAGRSQCSRVVERLSRAFSGLETCVSFLSDLDVEDSARALSTLICDLGYPNYGLPLTFRIAWVDMQGGRYNGDTARLAFYVDEKAVAVDVSVTLFSDSIKTVPLIMWLGHVTSLSVPSDVWHVLAGCLLPNLGELEIFLTMEPYSLLETEPRIYDPLALRVFRLTAEAPQLPDGPQCSVSAQQVLAFMKETVNIGRLSEFVLRNVVLEEDIVHGAFLPPSVIIRQESRPAYVWDNPPSPWLLQFPEEDALLV